MDMDEMEVENSILQRQVVLSNSSSWKKIVQKARGIIDNIHIYT
jgi:hypothetical protein